jgi:F-type H+-transporting ATPase subunit alpha
LIETQANDVSAYIPTNVISITDGQIFLESDLFYAGQRPAVNAGTSVSRVGSTAQTKAMKKVSGGIKLQLAQFRELAAFAQFGSDLDASTRAQLDRGQRITEALKQPQYQPMPVEDQVMIISAATSGAIDQVPVNRIADFKTDFTQYMRTTYPQVGRSIAETGALSDDMAETLRNAVRDFLLTTDYEQA